MTMSSLALEVARAHLSGRTFEHLNELLLNSLRTYRNRVLLHSWDGRSFSGREIEGEIARYVAALKRQGVAFGRTVGLLSGNCIEVLFAQHAISIIGAIFTPFHPMGAPADFAYILDDAAIDVVIVDKEHEVDIGKAIDLSGRSPRILTLGGGGENDLFLLASTEMEDRIDLLPIDPEAIARIVYTGGTTGVPKATLASYRAMSTMFGIQIADWQWPDTIRQLLVAPLSHVGAICFTPTIVGGGTLYVEKGFDPSRILTVIQQHKITCILMVPTMISALLDHPVLKSFDVSSLETIFLRRITNYADTAAGCDRAFRADIFPILWPG